MAVPPPSSSESPSQLSFSAAHYAKLAPQAFLTANLTSTPPRRPSGRGLSDCRLPTINTGSLSHANGSAVVRVGDTAVVCGVRAEILLASDVGTQIRLPDRQGGDHDSKDSEVIAELGLLVPNLELATGCSPLYMPGSPPTGVAQSLSQRILTLLRGTNLVGLDELVIWGEKKGEELDEDEGMEVEGDEGSGKHGKEVKAFWTLYIDLLFISLDGSAFDAAWGAVLAALGNTKLPRAWWDSDHEEVLCSPMANVSGSIQLRGLPVPLSAAVFEGAKETATGKETSMWVLDDPDDFEEANCRGQVTVVVDASGGKLLKVEMNGGGIDVEGIGQLAKRAEERWKQWRKQL